MANVLSLGVQIICGVGNQDCFRKCDSPSVMPEFILRPCRAFNYERKKAGSRLTETLCADASEEGTIDQTIQGILQLPQFQLVESLRNMKYRTELRNYISYIVQEETILLPYKMQHSSQTGTIMPQKMLYIYRHHSVERPT
jgi:hypothetical protein